jgi:hypothetical protein
MTCEPWPIVWPCEDLPGSPEQQLAAVDAARLLLWSRTGRRLGVCATTEAYVSPGGGYDCGRPYMTDDRLWHNGGVPGRNCAIWLENTPVVAVDSVTIEGQTVDPSTYRVEGSKLVRRGQCWPANSIEWPIPTTVTYRWGVPIDVSSPLWGLVSAAMGEVAFEIATAMCGGECRLPSRAITVTRYGATVQLQDPQQTIDNRLLGLELADQLILTVNPARRQQRSRVYSPDMPRRI